MINKPNSILSFLFLIIGFGALFNRQRRQTELRRHLNRTKEMVYCEKGYEILINSPDILKTRIPLNQSTTNSNDANSYILNRKTIITEMIETKFRYKAIGLGMDEFTYAQLIDQYRYDAELAAFQSVQAMKDTSKIIHRLNNIYLGLIK